MYTSRRLVTPRDAEEARALLGREGLLLPEDTDLGLGFEAGGRLVATGFRKGRVIMGVCVDPDHRGGQLAGMLMTALLTQANAAGIDHLFLFTKPDQVLSMRRLGFSHVATAPGHAALLEFGWPDCDAWLAATAKSLGEPSASRQLRGAVVMNANPFTLGHRYLVERAVARCGRLLIFVVQEDASAFPFSVRLDLVRQGVADIPHCVVLPGGPYMVTSATFPSYFTGRQAHAAAHAALDAAVFATRIAPGLGIAHRFVGTEPFSVVTGVYNDALAQTLDGAGIGFTVMERLVVDGSPVSASRVRALLAKGDVAAVRPLVPGTTSDWLRSGAAAPVLETLARRGALPH
ncbi:MAG: GNAT family N-acetyltransferase [Desulfovibrionaceae bacterium]